MKVRELIKRLEELDTPDAEVRIMTQPNWPFENSVQGVVTRAQFDEDEEDQDTVFITEGRQLRYGNKDAWS